MSLSKSEAGDIIRNGLWKNNQALVALLGLCPLLAVTNTAINGLGLGIATLAVITASNISVSIIRHWVRPEIRLPVFVLIIASFVTAIDLIMYAWFIHLHHILGIFIPLIVTNCTIIGRAEAYAARNSVGKAALDGLSMGLGFTLVLFVLGGLREMVGQGTFLQGAELLFGPSAAGLSLSLGDNFHGLLFAILPPGAFFFLGLLIALKNVIDKRQKSTRAVLVNEPARVSS